MEKMVKKGEFVPMSNRDILFEERLLLESLTLDTYFMDTTVMDALTIRAICPMQRDSMLGLSTVCSVKVKNTLPFLKWWRVFCSSQEENLKKQRKRVSEILFSCDKIIEKIFTRKELIKLKQFCAVFSPSCFFLFRSVPTR